MKEKELINTIKQTLNSKHIGDDCAYLEDLGIVVTQDSLVEGVHFLRNFTTPFELGYKSATVNLSDIAASGGEPKYLTVSLSLPKDTDKNFIKEFYDGLKTASGQVEIVGGDITGADKIFISITAIGSDKCRKIASRKNAKAGQKIVVSGVHGSSGAGLKQLLENNKRVETKFTKAHLMPKAQLEFSKKIAESIPYNYAMMDTSDGLADALSAIAEESGVCVSVDFNKIPHDKDLEQFEDWQDLILYGGEDYQLVAILEEKDAQNYTIIGEIKEGSGVEIKYSDHIEHLTKDDIEKNLYNHFR